MSELTPPQAIPTSSPLIEIRIGIPGAEAAHDLAKELVARNLAVSVQCVGPVTSVYRWKDKVHQLTEWLLLAKTTAELFDEVADLVTANHRYDVPEVIAVPVSHSLDSYSAWVRDSVLSNANND